MKKLTAIILAAFAVVLNASAELKVATVDMETIFTNYKRVEVVEGQIKKEIEALANKLESRRNEGIDMVKELEKLQEKYANTALAQSTRDAAKAQGEQIAQKLEQKRKDFEAFSGQERKKLAQKEQAQREEIYNQIKRTSIAIAKKQGATLVLDTSARGTAGFPTIIYSEDSIEITDAVLRLLNAGK